MSGFEGEGAFNVLHRRRVVAHEVMDRSPLVPALGEVRLRLYHLTEGSERRLIVATRHCLDTPGHKGVHDVARRMAPNDPNLPSERRSLTSPMR